MLTTAAPGMEQTQPCGLAAASPTPVPEADCSQPQPWGRVNLTPPPTGSLHLAPASRGQQQRRHPPTSTVAATAELPPCRANWLSKRKVEKPPQRRAAELRESTIPRKT